MTASSIMQIDVERLFGRYSYRLPVEGPLPAMSRLMLLYGDNGSGKTTILRLLFHLLAHEDNAGHKSVLGRTPFSRFKVTLNDGTVVEAFREGESVSGSYSMAIRPIEGLPTEVKLVTESDGFVTGHEEVLPPFLRALENLGLNLYMLPDDRRLRGNVERAPLESRRERQLHLWGEPRPADDSRRELVLNSISRFEAWIRANTLRGSSAGQANSDSIYADVIRRLVGLPHAEAADATLSIEELATQIAELDGRVQSFSKYGLVPEFRGSALADLLRRVPGPVQTAAHEVLAPYVEGLAARLDALQDAQAVIDHFVTSINSFYTHKEVVFDVRGGLEVRLDDGSSLDPGLLSSGERQILLLLCNCVTAPAGSVFVVDEPELSLNIKWQRQLATALLACTTHSHVQFVLATHSFELLAGHRECVVSLQDAS